MCTHILHFVVQQCVLFNVRVPQLGQGSTKRQPRANPWWRPLLGTKPSEIRACVPHLLAVPVGQCVLKHKHKHKCLHKHKYQTIRDQSRQTHVPHLLTLPFEQCALKRKHNCAAFRPALKQHTSDVFWQRTITTKSRLALAQSTKHY